MVTATAIPLEAIPCWLLLTMCSVSLQGRQPQLPLLKGLSHPETQQSLGVIAEKQRFSAPCVCVV